MFLPAYLDMSEASVTFFPHHAVRACIAALTKTANRNTWHYAVVRWQHIRSAPCDLIADSFPNVWPLAIYRQKRSLPRNWSRLDRHPAISLSKIARTTHVRSHQD
jgi:hypothetical protein